MVVPIRTGYVYKEHLKEHEEKLGDVWAVVNPSGNWQTTPPQTEEQDIGVEPECCTSEGNKGAFETLVNFLYGDNRVWSARLLAWLSNTTPEGNDIMTVNNTLGTKGTVEESVWPNTSALKTWDEFYATPPQAIIEQALELPAEYALDKRWIGTDVESLKTGLTISPIVVSGFAWAQDEDGLYYTPEGAQPCHCFFLIGYALDATRPNGIVWSAFDSYEQDIKALRGDYVFAEALQIKITKNVGSTPAEQSAWQSFIQWMQKIIGLGEYSAERLGSEARSPQWSGVRNDFLKEHPTCAICGGTKKLTVHHRQPFHTDKSRELDKSNLITLCEGAGNGNHHLLFGHFGNYATKWNTKLDADCTLWLPRFTSKTENEIQ